MIFKLVQICSICIVLSGCSMYSSIQEEQPSHEVSKVVNEEPVVSDIAHNKVESTQDQIEITHASMIDAQIASSIGESKSYFEKTGDSKVKIYILNTGTESFQYSIRNVNDNKKIVTGVLNTNETYENVLNDLPEGSYIISYVVVEETPPTDIALTVKVDLVGYE